MTSAIRTIDAAQTKKKKITEWARSIMGVKSAEEKGMVPITRITFWRNWTCREALYDMWLQNQFSQLVQVDPSRVALYAVPASAKAASK